MDEVLAAMPLAVRCLHARRQHLRRSMWPELANVACREIENLVRTLGVDIMPAIHVAAPGAVMLEAKQTLCRLNGAVCLKGMVTNWGLTKCEMVNAGYLVHMFYHAPKWWATMRDIFDINAADLIAWFGIRDSNNILHMHSLSMMRKGHFQKAIEVFSFTREEVIAIVNISTHHHCCLSSQQHDCVKQLGIGPTDIDHPDSGFIKSVLERYCETRYPILKELYGVTDAEAQQAVNELLREYGSEIFAPSPFMRSKLKSLTGLFQVTM